MTAIHIDVLGNPSAINITKAQSISDLLGRNVRTFTSDSFGGCRVWCCEDGEQNKVATLATSQPVYGSAIITKRLNTNDQEVEEDFVKIQIELIKMLSNLPCNRGDRSLRHGRRQR